MSTASERPRQTGPGRPDKRDYATLDEDTWFVHGGNRADDATGAVRPPIVMSNSYLLPEDPTTIDEPGYAGLVYSREQGANQRGLELKLGALDHGEAAAARHGSATHPGAGATWVDPTGPLTQCRASRDGQPEGAADFDPRQVRCRTTGMTAPFRAGVGHGAVTGQETHTSPAS